MQHLIQLLGLLCGLPSALWRSTMPECTSPPPCPPFSLFPCSAPPRCAWWAQESVVQQLLLSAAGRCAVGRAHQGAREEGQRQPRRQRGGVVAALADCQRPLPRGTTCRSCPSAASEFKVSSEETARRVLCCTVFCTVLHTCMWRRAAGPTPAAATLPFSRLACGAPLVACDISVDRGSARGSQGQGAHVSSVGGACVLAGGSLPELPRLSVDV